ASPRRAAWAGRRKRGGVRRARAGTARRPWPRARRPPAPGARPSASRGRTGRRRAQSGRAPDGSPGLLGHPDGVDEQADFLGILDPEPGLDPAGDVDAIGPEVAHDRAHVTRFESTRDEHLPPLDQLAGGVPPPRPPRPPALI